MLPAIKGLTLHKLARVEKTDAGLMVSVVYGSGILQSFTW